MRLALLLFLLPLPLMAQQPRVVTDIPPVHGLVSQVMQGIAEPYLILDRAGSAHDLALRPSQASDIAQADLIVWIGEGLSPALGRSFQSLAPDTPQIELLELPETRTLAYREADDFAKGNDGGEHDDHDSHDDHGHDKPSDHSDTAHSEDAHDHAHGDIDPHVWLDPDNAALWLSAIAKALAKHDPENAATYLGNAQNAAKEISQAKTRTLEALRPLQGRPLVVAHDGFQYLETAFGLKVIGAVSDSHDREAGPGQLDALRNLIAETPPVCILAEPGTQLNRLAAISENELPPVAEIDPLGIGIPFGQAHYLTHLDAMSNALQACLQG